MTNSATVHDVQIQRQKIEYWCKVWEEGGMRSLHPEFHLEQWKVPEMESRECCTLMWKDFMPFVLGKGNVSCQSGRSWDARRNNTCGHVTVYPTRSTSERWAQEPGCLGVRALSMQPKAWIEQKVEEGEIYPFVPLSRLELGHLISSPPVLQLDLHHQCPGALHHQSQEGPWDLHHQCSFGLELNYITQVSSFHGVDKANFQAHDHKPIPHYNGVCICVCVCVCPIVSVSLKKPDEYAIELHAF